MRRFSFAGPLLVLSMLALMPVRGADGLERGGSAREPVTAPDGFTDGASKIRFDLGRPNADGLQGPPTGLRALHYEYCIPDRANAVNAVTSIDMTLSIQQGSPGRVGCGENELLCLGHTHQPDYRNVLKRLAALPFVGEIREAFFE